MESTREAISTLTAERLLGRPLNDVETKYAPKTLYAIGVLDIPLPTPRVSIVGSRKASPEGLETAAKVARVLVRNQAVIVSGLALGIDTAAHKGTIAAGGRTIAVIGTPLDRFYPSQNADLQREIMRNHLVVSQFPVGHKTRPGDFPIRNRTMALISDATFIVEAGESSGSLHQGWEALRLGRSLFIWKTILEDKRLNWPQEMLDYGAMVISDPREMLESLPSSQRIENILA
ncbi:MAG: DNA-protecting protein DprA [Thaumarchaeota archaeon]|nr:DNA-protecting protein DprA [Nitrososphaerota archaeon]